MLYGRKNDAYIPNEENDEGNFLFWYSPDTVEDFETNVLKRYYKLMGAIRNIKRNMRKYELDPRKYDEVTAFDVLCEFGIIPPECVWPFTSMTLIIPSFGPDLPVFISDVEKASHVTCGIGRYSTAKKAQILKRIEGWEDDELPIIIPVRGYSNYVDYMYATEGYYE